MHYRRNPNIDIKSVVVKRLLEHYQSKEFLLQTLFLLTIKTYIKTKRKLLSLMLQPGRFARYSFRPTY